MSAHGPLLPESDSSSSSDVPDNQKPDLLQIPPLETLVSEPGVKHTASLLVDAARDLGGDMEKINRALERLGSINDDTDPSIVRKVIEELNKALDDELGPIPNELPEVVDIDKLLAKYDAENPT